MFSVMHSGSDLWIAGLVSDDLHDEESFIGLLVHGVLIHIDLNLAWFPPCKLGVERVAIHL